MLFAAWLFLALSFLSYAPQDLPTQFVYHDLQEIRNLAGLPGAWCAYVVSLCFGVVGYFIVVASGLALTFYFFLDRIEEPYNKSLGFFLMLIALSGATAYLFNSSYGPPIGPGGMVGALVKFLCDKFFNPLGACVSLVALFFAGLVLVLPEKALKVIFWSTGLGSVVGRVFRPFLQRIQLANPKKTQAPVTRVGYAPSRRDAIDLRRGRREFSAVWNSPREEKRAQFSPIVLSEHVQNAPRFGKEGTVQSCGRDLVHASVEVNELRLDPQTSGAVLTDASQFVNYGDERDESQSESLNFEALRDKSSCDEYVYPSIELLEEGSRYDPEVISEQIRERGQELERVCRSFKVELKVVDIQTGPVLTLYEVELQKGLRVKALQSLTNDLEIAMKASHARIVSPIPGKNTVGIELPNEQRQLVRLREVMESCAAEAQKMDIPIFLGKDVVGAPMVADLAKLPHLLIAGRTGTGKSVCLNSIIMSILMTKSPKEVRFIMIDPKMVELSPYKKIPHLMHPVVVDMQKAEAILEWAVEKMEERYRLFARVGVRKISEFNRLSPETLLKRLRPQDEDEWEAFPKSMPSIVIVADEMADLIMTSGKDVERHIVRLAQKSRAVGIHLVLATQKPTVDVVTGLIKSNLPARIAFGVASRVDSQVVLDVKGAEQLLGNGDMLFLLPGTSQLVRGQGAFVSDREIDSVIEAISVDKPNYEIEIPDLPRDEEEEDSSDVAYDEYYIPAVDSVIEEGRASASGLQRKFSIGYTRAARIIDTMTKEGIISPFNPAKPSRARDVLITMEQWRGKQFNAANVEQNNVRPGSFPSDVPSSSLLVKQNASRTSSAGVTTETAAVRQSVVLAPSEERRAESERRDLSLSRDETEGLKEKKKSDQDDAKGENKDKGWSDEQWNQYINFDSELD